jgi:hypothetical protein
MDSQRKSALAAALESPHVYKAVTLVLWVALFGTVSAVWNRVGSPQSFKDFGVLLAVVCVILVVGFLGLLGRLAGVDRGEDDPADRRSRRLVIGGLLLGLLLAAGLTVYNVMDSRMDQQSAEAARAQREMLGRLGR